MLRRVHASGRPETGLRRHHVSYGGLFSASIGRLTIRRSSELARYLWERSGSRSVRLHRDPRPSPEALARIRGWAESCRAPALSVCIPTTDRLDLLLPCLDSIAATCARKPVEVIIGDTGSSGRTLELYSRLHLQSVSVPPPFNFSRACNEMARVARGEALVFLNSDTRAETANWVEPLLEAPEDEIVGAALVYPGTRRLQHAGVEVVRQQRFLRRNAYLPPYRHRAGATLALQNIGTGRRVETLTADRANVLAVTGAFLYTSRARFNALSGFDEAYRVDLQDVDYCLRGRARGMRVTCRRDVIFSHKHAATRGRYRFPLDDWRLFVGRWGDELQRWQSAGGQATADGAEGAPRGSRHAP
jgi:GT2 family glycosyltransferase